jgi:hypothetical protein
MLAYAKQEELSILYINGGWWMAKNKLGKLGSKPPINLGANTS